MLDFELAERRPWERLHPSHRTRGCIFHFSQSVWRYVLTNGGSNLYATNAVVRGLVWMGFSLPFVPVNRLQEAVQLMIDEFSSLERENQGIYDWCTSFVDGYLDGYWLNGPHNPVLWNVSIDPNEHLTNNSAEGANNRLNTRVGKHPNIFQFFSSIKTELQNTCTKLHQAEH